MKIIVFDTETTGLPKKVIVPKKTVGEEEHGDGVLPIKYAVASETVTIWPHIVQFSYIVYDTTINEILKVSDNTVLAVSSLSLSASSSSTSCNTSEA